MTDSENNIGRTAMLSDKAAHERHLLPGQKYEVYYASADGSFLYLRPCGSTQFSEQVRGVHINNIVSLH